jgi:hypothetical protein
MELYEMELEKAAQHISAAGRNKDDFQFKMEYQEPDPDAGGMFTVRYDIEITHSKTGKSLKAVGGIGLDWVGYFADALTEGYFD